MRHGKVRLVSKDILRCQGSREQGKTVGILEELRRREAFGRVEVLLIWGFCLIPALPRLVSGRSCPRLKSKEVHFSSDQNTNGSIIPTFERYVVRIECGLALD